MGLEVLGRNAAVGIGFESTEGTAVAAARWARLASLTLNKASVRQRIDDLSLGGTGYIQDRYLEAVTVTGSLELIAYYQNGSITSFLRAIVGGTWSTTGAGPFTHSLEPGAAPPAVTLRTARDTLNTSGALQRGDVIAGARVTSATITINTPNTARIAINFVAMSSTPGSAPTPSLPAHSIPVLYHHANRWLFNSVSYTPRNVSLSLENGVEGITGQGSASITGAAVTGIRTAQATVTRFKDNDNWPDAHTAGTESDADITYTSGADQFRIDLRSAIILEPVAIESTSVGLVEETAVFAGRSDGTNAIVKFVVVNGDTNAEDS